MITRPMVRIARPPRKLIVAQVDPVEVSRIVGKGLTLWVLFTSGLNWLMYRKINKK
jgi:hypothetical protein